MALENFVDSASSTIYGIVRSHARVSGTISLPTYWVPQPDNRLFPNGIDDRVGGHPTPTPCKIVRLHGPIESMTISWTAIKEGASPKVPNPYLLSTNLYFKQGARSGAIPVSQAGYKGHSWSMSGAYEYHVLSPVDLNSSMPLGIHPWENDADWPNRISIDDSIMPNDNFVSYLLEKLSPTAEQPFYIPPS